MKIKTLIIGLFVFAFTATAHAQHTPQVSKRQAIQKQRIKQGKKSGALTKKEAYKLRKQQRKVTVGKRMAKADGKVTRKEKAYLRKKQNKASRSIFRAKRNKRVQRF